MIIGSYAALSLPGANKVSKMQADANGYYRMCLGGFNVCNDNGKFYPLTDTVKGMFAPGSIVRKRIDNGYMKAELGHPDITGLSHIDILKRLAHIDPTRVCAHFADIQLDYRKDEHGKEVVLVIGRVKPSGPYAESLRKQFDNPEENVCFSVRSFSKNGMYQGKAATLITDILTYDAVTEPGIRFATQFNTVSLEGANHLMSLHDISFTEKDFAEAMRDSHGYSQESNIISNLKMIKTSFGWQKVQVIDGLSSTNW